MITLNADLFKVERGFIVHGCNMVPVMGSGVARGIRELFPKAHEVYMESFKEGHSPALGDITVATITPDLFVVNMLTQASVGEGLQTSYDAIEIGFHTLQVLADILNPQRDLPICFPLIGAVRGGGSWEVISELIESRRDWYGRELRLYKPDTPPAMSA